MPFAVGRPRRAPRTAHCAPRTTAHLALRPPPLRSTASRSYGEASPCLATFAASAGGHVSYLLKLIMEDEARHHRLFDEWRNALQSNAEFREVEPQVPHMSRSKEADTVREAAREFLEVERADERDLHRLQKSLKTVKDTTIWSLLVDMMELDTKKHQLILEFLEKHPGD
jgi:rubrerythrin